MSLKTSFSLHFILVTVPSDKSIMCSHYVVRPEIRACMGNGKVCPLCQAPASALIANTVLVESNTFYNLFPAQLINLQNQRLKSFARQK